MQDIIGLARAPIVVDQEQVALVIELNIFDIVGTIHRVSDFCGYCRHQVDHYQIIASSILDHPKKKATNWVKVNSVDRVIVVARYGTNRLDGVVAARCCAVVCEDRLGRAGVGVRTPPSWLRASNKTSGPFLSSLSY